MSPVVGSRHVPTNTSSKHPISRVARSYTKAFVVLDTAVPGQDSISYCNKSATIVGAMPKRGIASFFSSLPKKQKTNADDQEAPEAIRQDNQGAAKGYQKRLSPAKVSPVSKVPCILWHGILQHAPY